MANDSNFVVRSPILPSYEDVRTLIAIWKDTTARTAILNLINFVWTLTGTPQSPVDWSDPDQWIDERLSEPHIELAKKIWKESKKTINPRHIYGEYLFINLYKLLVADHSGIYRITEMGERFLADDPEVVRKIDEAEGIPKLLAILAAHSPAKRGDLLPEWGTFLSAHSKYGTPATIKGTLRHRILNLVERGFINRQGNTYTIKEKGIAYAADSENPESRKPYHDVLSTIKTYNETQTADLRARLSKMNPYLFEVLVKDLLEAMDYEDVTVTKQSGDKGIDVVAKYEFGITQIKEVVQVKRHQGSITRPVLDQLRGVLPFHQAIRGTIITLGKFAQGCKDVAIFPGAPPITLIDGDKLIELMVKFGVGIKKNPQLLFEVDDTYFSGMTAPESAALETEETESE